MDKPTAEELRDSIRDFAKSKGLWVDVQETYKPELKDIIVTVSIRVTEKQ